MADQTEALRETVRRAIRSQPQSTVTTLSSLLAVEEAIRYIPTEAVEEVAAHIGVTVNDVWAVATFYTNFRFQPPGERVVEVCWGPTCHIMGAQGVLQRIQQALGLEGEGDTPDGRVTLRYNTCIGACTQAPVIAIDHQAIGRVTPDSVQGILSSAAHNHGRAPESAGD